MAILTIFWPFFFEGDSDLDDGLMRFPRRPGSHHDGLRGLEPPEPQLSADGTQTVRKLPVSTDDLRKAWAVSRRVSKDDWLEWYVPQCGNVKIFLSLGFLREINFGYCKSAKDAIFAIRGALNF